MTSEAAAFLAAGAKLRHPFSAALPERNAWGCDGNAIYEGRGFFVRAVFPHTPFSAYHVEVKRY